MNPQETDPRSGLEKRLARQIGPGYARRILTVFGLEALSVLEEDPFRLVEELRGIGPKTADRIAARLGLAPDRPARLRSGLKYLLRLHTQEGHCYVLREVLLEEAAGLTGTGDAALSEALDDLLRAGEVIPSFLPDSDWTALYLPEVYRAENGIRDRLDKIAGTPPPPNAQAEAGDLPPAVRPVLAGKVTLVPCGPGAPKDAFLSGLLGALRGQTVLLAAPTGASAVSLSALAGREAVSLRQLLQYAPPEGCRRNAENPLRGDVLLVDGCAALDVFRMHALLRAVPDPMRLILMGDPDLIPSVGAGNVFRDLLESGVFPIVPLPKPAFPAGCGQIALNARRIARGACPDLSNRRGTDCFFQRAGDPTQAAQVIAGLVKERLPAFCHSSPREVQVLTPSRSGPVGASSLNRLLQAAVNPPRPGPNGAPIPEIRLEGRLFRQGDKVMQAKTDLRRGVFAGETGLIERIDPIEQTLLVRFDGRAVSYDAREADDLTLAWALPIQSVPDAVFPVVVLPILGTRPAGTSRSLLYTGVSRAGKTLVLVGQREAIAACVSKGAENRRNTLLADRLRGRTDQAAPLARYICFDVETPNALNERMSAIGLAVVERGRIVREFFSYVDPEQPFDAFNTQLTGIDASTVSGAPTFAALWPRLAPLLSGGILVAHNAPFDLTVLQKCLSAYGIKWEPRVRYLCTVRIGRGEMPTLSHRLNDLCAYFGIPLDHHQADSDSHACAEILRRYMLRRVRLCKYLRSFEMSPPVWDGEETEKE